MASLCPVVILFLQLLTFYVHFAGAGETPLGCPCNADTDHDCKTLNAICSLKCVLNDNSGCPTRSPPIGNRNISSPCGNNKAMNTCICKNGYYEDNNHGCNELVFPNHKCVNSTDMTGPCVHDAICNASGVCVYSKNNIPNLTSCTQASTSHPSSHTGQTTVLKPTSNQTGRGMPNSDSSGILVKTTMKTTVQTARQTTTPGVGAPNTDSSRSAVKPTVQTTTPGNSAATVAVVEISAYILCFILAYVNVPN